MPLFLFHLFTGCYIEPIKARKQQPYRIIAFDCETKQHVLVDEQKGKRTHQVNFIAAQVACAECISSGKWRQSLLYGTGCAVCGMYRTVAFAECGFKETKVDKMVVTDDPCLAFIKWLLYEMPIDYESVIFSHYGSRFIHTFFIWDIHYIYIIDSTWYYSFGNFLLKNWSQL